MDLELLSVIYWEIGRLIVCVVFILIPNSNLNTELNKVSYTHMSLIVQDVGLPYLSTLDSSPSGERDIQHVGSGQV